MRIEEALRWGAKELQNIAQRPRFEAEILLGFTLSKERLWLHLHPKNALSSQEEELYRGFIHRRKEGEPIEYITQRVSFYAQEFFITKGVLIPRPETELLVDEVSKELSGSEKVLEIGVGSGVISITLAKKFPNLKIFATDINPLALEVTKKNIERFNINNIELIQTSFWDGIEERFDIIVSNPPYIAKDYPLPKPLEYEPKEALFGGVKGDEMIKELIERFFTSSAKILVCEMGYNQKDAIEGFVGKKNIRFYKDLAGFYRGFVLKR